MSLVIKRNGECHWRGIFIGHVSGSQVCGWDFIPRGKIGCRYSSRLLSNLRDDLTRSLVLAERETAIKNGAPNRPVPVARF